MNTALCSNGPAVQCEVERGKLTAFLVDHAVFSLLRGHGAGRAVVGKLRHVTVARTRASPARHAARRPGDPLRHGAGGSIWRKQEKKSERFEGGQ